VYHPEVLFCQRVEDHEAQQQSVEHLSTHPHFIMHRLETFPQSWLWPSVSATQAAWRIEIRPRTALSVVTHLPQPSGCGSTSAASEMRSFPLSKVPSQTYLYVKSLSSSDGTCCKTCHHPARWSKDAQYHEHDQSGCGGHAPQRQHAMSLGRFQASAPGDAQGYGRIGLGSALEGYSSTTPLAPSRRDRIRRRSALYTYWPRALHRIPLGRH
jgi:hypothetical protein